jgi:hypothetical protein
MKAMSRSLLKGLPSITSGGLNARVSSSFGSYMMESQATSSRLCIKGLPKTFIDERKLREHFSSRGGEITDLKLLKTK